MAPVAYSPRAGNDFEILQKMEYPVILPGEFPAYCWEEITNNRLSRCVRGEKYRKTKICRHTVRQPIEPSGYQSAQYKAYASADGRKS